MKYTLAAAFAAALPLFTSAHYTFPHLIVDGQVTREWEYVRKHTQGFMPQFGDDIVTKPVMRCNTGSEGSGPNTKVFTVKPGQTVGFETNVKAKVEHPGPMQVYLSKAPGSVQEYAGDGDWFKVYELLYNLPFTAKGDNWKVWGKNQFTFPIPEGIAGGEYLMRIEHIAIHGGTKPKGPEMYFSCAQIKIDSDTVSTPSPVVKIPGVYGARGPALMFNMYTNPLPTSAPRPGPEIAIFSRSSGSGTSPAPVSSSAPISISTSVSVPIKVVDPTPTTTLKVPTTLITSTKPTTTTTKPSTTSIKLRTTPVKPITTSIEPIFTSVKPSGIATTFQCEGEAPAEPTGAWDLTCYA